MVKKKKKKSNYLKELIIIVTAIVAIFAALVLYNNNNKPDDYEPQFSGEDAYNVLSQLIKQQRYYGAPEREQAIDFLKRSIKKSANNVIAQKFKKLETSSQVEYTLVNIIGRQNTKSKERIIIGSHWDSRLWAERDPEEKNRDIPIEGANDGGSGVAVIIELAKITRNFKNIGIDYVFFDGEEFGREGSDDYCQGSRYFAKNIGLLYPDKIPSQAIIIDMVGDADQQFYYEKSSVYYAPELTKRIWTAASDFGFSQWIAQAKYHIVDDHTPLQELGIKAILMIDYDYPYWHKQSDRIDKVSAQSLERVGKVILKILFNEERKM